MITNSTGTIIVDRELNLVEVQENYLDFCLRGKRNSFIDCVKPEDRYLLSDMIALFEKEEKASLCFRLLKKNGEYGWVMAFCHKNTYSSSFNIKISLRDVPSFETEDKDEELDFSTGLLTKKAIIDYARKRCESEDNIVNLCILDIDNFKNINDTRGHSFGDQVLKDVAGIIKTVLADGGRAGRIGGDELMLVIDKAIDRTQLRSYLKPIREKIEALYHDINGLPLVTVSVGAATFPTYTKSYESLFNLADRMLYRAKSRGKNRYVMYNPDIHGKVVDGILNENFKTIQDAASQDKIKLVLGTIDGFFSSNMELSVGEVLTNVVATYNLDEAYIYYGNLKKSFIGYMRVESSALADKKGVTRVIEADLEAAYLTELSVEDKFNSNGVLVIDSPEKQLNFSREALSFFNRRNIKHAYIYKMTHLGKDSFVVLYNTRELSRKFPQPDIIDFTYLAKMIEVALKSR